jgi:peptide/nickel transport system permease protein
MVVQRIVDAWMCFPGLILLIVMVSLVGPGLLQVIVVLGLQYGIAGSRVVRGAVFGIKGNVYIEAASAIGCTTRRTLLRHILPNVMAPIIILFTTRMPAIILGEASLSFLGLGIPPPDPSWGGMLSGSGRTYMLLNPYMALWPGLALSIVVYGINMFGDALRDLLDPRLRGGLGRYGSGRQEKARQKALAGTETAAAGR